MENRTSDDSPRDHGQASAKRRLDDLRHSELLSSRSHWSSRRLALAGVIESHTYQIAVGIAIGIHAILIIQETDLRASGSKVQAWRDAINYVFLLMYFIDLALRLHVYRWTFFHGGWNQIDFLVVAADVLSQALASTIGSMPSFAVVRICRLSRLLRFIRFLRMFRELDIMLMGFLSAMRAMFWAACMLVAILTFFSIVAVEVINPIVVRLVEQGAWKDCDRCQRAFSSVMGSNLTFMQQIIAGDSWGLISIPIIEEEPLTAIFLVTVIVDVANSARAADELRKLDERAHEFELAKSRLMSICEELDEDESGELSLDELLKGLDTNPRFAQLMAALEIERDDMPLVFKLLDEDGSGTVVYKEFVEQLHKIKSQDTHTTLMFIKGHLNEVRSKVSEQLALLQDEILSTNIDMATSIRKILFGEPLLKSPGPRQALSEVDDKAALSIQLGLCAVAGPVGAACLGVDKVTLQAQPDVGANGKPRGKDESFLGLVRLEETLKERLLRLEEQVGGELAQLTRDMAGQVNKQLALLQDWGLPKQPAALSTQEVEPSSDDADAKEAEPDGSEWNLNLWEPSRQGTHFGAEQL